MRLLKCHVENFGILSDFDYTFNPGLTVIREPNGFGKSTLAAFIKAMFYGFPRTGARNIIENERRRYEPWQGGKYGGYVEFFYENTEYRVERFFGRTAAKDSFSLYDLTNRRESRKFSEKLGEELFQLDAESFVRSTYMPQLSERNTFATTSIRTKLSNLVDDTNDMNNYDSAKEKLRGVRTGYRNYRGVGGKIQELQSRIEKLSEELQEAETEKIELQETVREITQVKAQRTEKEKEIKHLREDIRFASNQKTMRVQKQHLERLKNEVKKAEEGLEKVDSRYPNGYPERKEIRLQQDNLHSIAQQEEKRKGLALPEEIFTAAKEGERLFADSEQAESDMELCRQQCNELAEIRGKLTAQMTQEDREHLKELSEMFREGVPSQEELSHWQERANCLAAIEGERRTAVLPQEEQEKLIGMDRFFANGIPEEEALDACSRRQQEIDMLIQQRENCGLEAGEQEELKKLSRYFSVRVPAEEEIFEKQQKCRRVAELNGKKNVQTAVVQQQDPKPQNSKKWMILGIVGCILLLIGAGFFAASLFAGGAVLAVAGFAALLGAFWMYTKQMLRAGRAASAIMTESAITEEESRELYELQRNIDEFILQFYSSATGPEEQLTKLLMDRRRFAELSEKQSRTQGKKKTLSEEAGRLEEQNRQVFAKFYPGEEYRADFAGVLKEKLIDYRALRDRMDRTAKKQTQLKEQACRIDEELQRVLGHYYSSTGNWQATVMQLGRDRTAYLDLQDRQEQMRRGADETGRRNEELKASVKRILEKYEAYREGESYDACLQALQKRFTHCRDAVQKVKKYEEELKEVDCAKKAAELSFEDFLVKYGFDGTSPQELIEQVEEDQNLHQRLCENLCSAKEALSAYQRENPKVGQTEIIESYADPEELQKEEREKQGELDAIDQNLRNLRQKRDELRRKTEKIPEWQDQIAQMEEERADAEKKCDLLDKTMEFLEQAKDNLALSYVGKVERGFRKYADKLLDTRAGRVMVDKDLQIYIDEQGVRREAGCYSVGTMDSIMLCMRLALADALFAQEKPFIIMDDPFVNLDDLHTEQALAMLEKIADIYQVVYLVCNSSRCGDLI